MIPKKVIKGEKIYFLVKEYDNYGLYKDLNGMRECFSKFQLGMIKEKIKPEREAKNGGIIKH